MNFWRSLSLALALFSGVSMNGQQRVYVFDIKEEIAPPVWRKTKKALDEAHTLNVDVIVIRMNTYGGAVDAADSIRTKILQSTIPVYVLIENNAASAGALISLACDSIFMQPGSTIGAATVVDQNGEQVPDKYQSYMRKKMRATAEETGRNPDIAEAMVDPDKVVEGVSEKGKVVTLTVSEAIALGFCDGEYSTVVEVLSHCGITDFTIIQQDLTWTDHVIGWLIHPAVSGVLILIIFGGIYFELQTPGIGFPSLAALVAAIMYFAPLYLEGLAANWEILLFLLGVALLAVEVFVIPGFGVAGIAGITLVVSALALSMIGNVGFDFEPVDTTSLFRSFLIAILASALSVGGSIYAATRLFDSPAFSHAVLSATQRKEEGFVGTSTAEFDLIGKIGITHTNLRPSGKVEVDGTLHDATSEGGFIEAGRAVKVIAYASAQIKVRPTE